LVGAVVAFLISQQIEPGRIEECQGLIIFPFVEVAGSQQRIDSVGVGSIRITVEVLAQ
jgi:hypothetical protein